MLKRFRKDERGATAVEYGIIVAVLSLTITGALGLTLNAIENNFMFVKNTLDAAYED
jgi:pilus assembly protein Flp/PilA